MSFRGVIVHRFHGLITCGRSPAADKASPELLQLLLSLQHIEKLVGLLLPIYIIRKISLVWLIRARFSTCLA